MTAAAEYAILIDSVWPALVARHKIASPKEQPMPTPLSLIEKIKALPDEHIVEVEDFVDFIAARARSVADAFRRDG
jgi:hypothetical protein